MAGLPKLSGAKSGYQVKIIGRRIWAIKHVRGNPIAGVYEDVARPWSGESVAEALRDLAAKLEKNAVELES